MISTVVFMKISDRFSKEENERIHQHLDENSTKETIGESTNTSAGDFETHLPIVILDTDGQKIMSKLDEVDDPKININVQIVDNEDGSYNHVGDTPKLTTMSTVRYRGNSSLYYDKKQYALKFFNEDGTDNDLSVMGMSAGAEWVLNGTFLDKSLIRNYLAYNIAGEIMDYAPNIRFCEVFINDGTTYEYQGL